MTNITCGCAMRWEIGKTGPLCDYIEHFLGYHKQGIVVKLATDQFKYQVLKVSHRLLVTHHPQKYDVEGVEVITRFFNITVVLISVVKTLAMQKDGTILGIW